MQDDDFFYPDAFEFNNVIYSGQRMSSANTLLISISSKDCPFDIGDIVTQKVGSKERFFEVLDWQIQTSFDINGKPFVAALIVQSLDVKNKSTTNIIDYKFNGSVSATNPQAGNNTPSAGNAIPAAHAKPCASCMHGLLRG